METPRERTPPFRDAPAEPFDAGSTFNGAVAGAGDGGVGGGGVDGSTLRLPENIDMKRGSYWLLVL